MKKIVLILTTLCVIALVAYAYMLQNSSDNAQIPAPVVAENGEILSDPANQVRAEFLAPDPDSVEFN